MTARHAKDGRHGLGAGWGYPAKGNPQHRPQLSKPYVWQENKKAALLVSKIRKKEKIHQQYKKLILAVSILRLYFFF